ncbi:TPA: hypothetical protein ACROG4_001753 [Staphylococcus aureus]|nr:hypothetical protein [Staphylococcus aureus]
MTTKTVFDVIDMGLGYLVNVYDAWKVEDEVPSIERILEGLQTLPERARNLTEDDLAIELKQPIVGCNNLEELLVLNAIHIPLHAGKIEEMSRILKNLK